VRHNRLFGTTSFRLAAIYVSLFTLSVTMLGVVVYLMVGREIELAFDSRVQSETAELSAVPYAKGFDALAEEIRHRILQAGSLDYRLEDANGHFLAGNLPSPRTSDSTLATGWVRVNRPEYAGSSGVEASPDSRGERALVARLDNGGMLMVGHELNEIEDARRAVLIAFAWALAATLVLGIGGGVLLSGGFLRRIDSMSQVAEGIIAGDLRRRIPQADAGDELGGLARTFNNMFDRIQSLVETNRYVGQSIAHDLRKPLARIVRRLEGTRRTGMGVREYEGVVDSTIADVHGVLYTFSALLRIAEIETGARRAGFKKIDLAVVAEEVSEAFRPAAEDEGKTIASKMTISLSLAGDKELLTQMVANLIDNALRHTPKGTRIDIGSRVMDETNVLVIADNGPGVAERHRAHIFERFYRVDAARSTPGNGLGLSLVAAIAELHGLQVSTADNRPGFQIILAVPASK
jgi:signal transduction histidine kinase